MRYAITFTKDDSWNTVDTFIVETDITPLDMTNDQLVEMFESYTDDAEEIVAESERWFLKNLEDTDVFMQGDM